MYIKKKYTDWTTHWYQCEHILQGKKTEREGETERQREKERRTETQRETEKERQRRRTKQTDTQTQRERKQRETESTSLPLSFSLANLTPISSPCSQFHICLCHPLLKIVLNNGCCLKQLFDAMLNQRNVVEFVSFSLLRRCVCACVCMCV